MPCTPFVIDGRGVGIVCTKGRRVKVEPCGFCSLPSARLCDYPILPGRDCDRPTCTAHAYSLGPERDLCPLHAPPRRRAEHPFGTDVFAPLELRPVPHGLGCPRCDAGLCHGCSDCRGERAHRIAPRRLQGPWVAVVGARDHGNLGQLDGRLDALPPETVVVSGGARGVDGYGIARARARGLRTVVLDADWTKGKTAGFVRNGEVVVVVDRVIAATWWGCRGTLDTLAKAEAVGLEVERVKPSASQFEIWTSRLSSSHPDPDTLDITNMSARGQDQVLAPRWKAIPLARRPGQLVKEMREWDRAGLSLVEAQRRARAEHAPSIGGLWAPPSKLLFPTLEALHALEGRAEAASPAAREEVLAEVRAEAARVWAGYAEAFLAEMRQRFTRFPDAWGWLLGRRRVVLACACSRPSYHDPAEPWTRCHRFLVAEALWKCGGRTMGELPGVNPSPAQMGLSF